MKNKANDASHYRAAHQRWMDKRNRKMEQDDYLEQWSSQQCGMCAFWLPLGGMFGEDYGVCSNPDSTFDSHCRFEHDGCESHVGTPEWVVPT